MATCAPADNLCNRLCLDHAPSHMHVTHRTPCAPAIFASMAVLLCMTVAPAAPPQVNEPMSDNAIRQGDNLNITFEDTDGGSPLFTDPDGDALTYEAYGATKCGDWFDCRMLPSDNGECSTGAGFCGLPDWITFDPETRSFTGTPEDEAYVTGFTTSITIRIIATDPGGDTASDVFELYVSNRNDAPVAATIPDVNVDEEDASMFVDLSAYFSDQDLDDELTYSATFDGGTLPPWLDFDENEGHLTTRVSGPSNDDVGSHSMVVTATDNNSAGYPVGTLSTAQSFALVVLNTNDPPVVSLPIPDPPPAAVDAPYSFSFPPSTFDDIDQGDALVYSATLATDCSSGGNSACAVPTSTCDGANCSLPDWLSFVPTQRSFSGTPGAADAASSPLSILIVATDVAGASARDTVSLQINGVYDYGDAPDPTYPTLTSSGGAAHLVGSLYMGASVDTDLDGAVSADATGDDVDGTDDEDGVSIATLTQGASAAVDIVASGAGYVSAWFDWNADGDWLDAGEQVLAAVAVTAGANSTTISVPAGASAGSTFARFRLESTGTVGPGGSAPDGEVEDYQVTVNAGISYDYGDAPDPTYPTLLANDGARHRIVGDIYLGRGVTADIDGQPDAGAGADSLDDGILEGGITSIEADGYHWYWKVITGAAGLLSAWFDLNHDGDWDDVGEQLINDVALPAGTTMVQPQPVPLGTPEANLNMRVRFSTQAGLGPTGEASDGEVEDMQHPQVWPMVDYGDLPDPSFATYLANDGARHLIDTSMYLGALVDADDDGQPHADAAGDDSDGIDDDDGVTFASQIFPDSALRLEVVASAAGYLSAWLDLNGDGDLGDPDEQLIMDTLLAAGTNTCVVPVPASATPGPSFMRFRFSSDTGLTTTGCASDGEVEDYAIAVGSLVGLRMHPMAPAETTLYPFWRTPSTGAVHVSFYNRTAGPVKLLVLTLAGEVVNVVANDDLGQGLHHRSVSTGGMSGGSYLARLVTPDKTITRHVLLP